MKKIVLTFGLISGAIVLLFSIPLWFAHAADLDLEHGEIIGYSVMFLAFVVVFFGIRQYRSEVGGGTITFGRAFKVGILMVLITCAVYVISWEVVYANFMSDFMEKYTAKHIEKMRADGKPAAEIAAEQKQMAEFAESYKNPLVRVGFSLLEIFPLGLITTLISAAILRRPGTPSPVPSAAL